MLLRIPAVSAFQDNILFVFGEPIEVSKVSLLFENVLTEYTITESKMFTYN